MYRIATAALAAMLLAVIGCGGGGGRQSIVAPAPAAVLPPPAVQSLNTQLLETTDPPAVQQQQTDPPTAQQQESDPDSPHEYGLWLEEQLGSGYHFGIRYTIDDMYRYDFWAPRNKWFMGESLNSVSATYTGPVAGKHLGERVTGDISISLSDLGTGRLNESTFQFFNNGHALADSDGYVTVTARMTEYPCAQCSANISIIGENVTVPLKLSVLRLLDPHGNTMRYKDGNLLFPFNPPAQIHGSDGTADNFWALGGAVAGSNTLAEWIGGHLLKRNEDSIVFEGWFRADK